MLLSICLIFCQFQPVVAYKSVAYKKKHEMPNGESSYDENLLEIGLQSNSLKSYCFNNALFTNNVVSSTDHKMDKITNKRCSSYVAGAFHTNKDQKICCKENQELSVQKF